MLGHLIPFHVVPSSFPIETDGILGSQFCEGTADILCTQQCVMWHGHRLPFANATRTNIPARSNSGTFINIINTSLTEGIVPRIDVAPGVYLGDAIVRNNNGRAYRRVINTTNKDVEISTPMMSLEKFEPHIALTDKSQMNRSAQRARL